MISQNPLLRIQKERSSSYFLLKLLQPTTVQTKFTCVVKSFEESFCQLEKSKKKVTGRLFHETAFVAAERPRVRTMETSWGDNDDDVVGH